MRNALWNVQYIQRLLALNPIALWAQDDKTAVAWDSSRNWRNGTHSNVTVGQPGIGDGNTSVLYAPANNSFTNVYSPSFRDAINGSTGSVVWWMSHNNWAGAGRDDVFLIGNAALTSYIHSRKNSASTLYFEYNAGGVLETLVIGGHNPSGFQFYAITWDKPNDVFRGYIAGTQVAFSNALGIWAGPITNTTSVIGATNTVPANVWDGCIDMFVICDYVLDANAMANLNKIQ